MVNIIFCGIIYFIFIIFDLMPLAKNKEYKAFWFYTVILILTYAVHILTAIGVQVPSPAEPIADGIGAIFNVRS